MNVRLKIGVAIFVSGIFLSSAFLLARFLWASVQANDLIFAGYFIVWAVLLAALGAFLLD
jgi:hypothetical protein